MRPRGLAGLTIAALLAATLPAPSSARPASPAPHDGIRVLVRFAPDTMRSARYATHRDEGTRQVGRIAPIDVDVLEIDGGRRVEDVVASYRRSSRILWAEPNYRYRIAATPNDPFFGGNGSGDDQWGLNNVGQAGGVVDADVDAPEGWDLAGGASGSPWPAGSYAIGIVDTGVDASHEDLAGKVITPCFKALGGTGTLSPGCGDDNDHGTHVSGAAAAVANNGRGGAGVAFDARIYMCKALDFAGSGVSSDIAACINDIVDRRAEHNIRVLSLSLGGTPSAAVRSAVDRAAANGIVVLAAAGNSGTPAVEYPAGYESVVGVGATNRFDGRAGFSNFNSTVEVSAPGERILSTERFNSYGLMSGTSMSAPLAAGVAAMISSRTGKTGPALRDALRAATDDLGPPGRDDQFGYGRVNLCKGLGGGSCRSTSTPPPVTPTPVPPTPTPGGTTPSPGSPTPSPQGEGVLSGRATWFFGFPAWFAGVQVSGAAQASVSAGFDGRYSVTLPAGRYTVSATVLLFLSCRADSASGPPTATVTISPGQTTSLDWFC